ncbi:MAG: CoA transferase, partial [Chloroflexi bacterium]|nr:CoA transferase [Chloroflexota bacterium]
ERDDPPLIAGNGVTDQITGIMLSHGIIAALYAREKMGIGQEVDTSLLGSAIFLQANMINGAMLLGRELNRPLRSKAANPLWNYYQCGDNNWICLGMLQSERYWEDFCEAIGRPELPSDVRFKTMKDRRSNCEELIRILDSVFATKPRDAWCKVFQQKRFIFAPIQNHMDLPRDPQVTENKYIVDFDHPDLGKIRTFGFPVEFSKTPAIIRSAAPTLGQHTEEILLELGYTWEGIGELRDTGVI